MARLSAVKKAVNAANVLSSEELSRAILAELDEAGSTPRQDGQQGSIQFTTGKGRTFALSSRYRAREIDEEVKVQVLDLLKSNMKDMYDQSSSIKWNDREKRDDVDHFSSRFLLAWQDSKLAGYLLFRFDTEDCDPDDPCARQGQEQVEIAYVYELQIAPFAQGAGLGALLMRLLERLSRMTKMRKVMLTCFSFNTAARKFYQAQGYQLDLISPCSDDEESDAEEEEEDDEPEPDYRIMSKDVFTPT